MRKKIIGGLRGDVEGPGSALPEVLLGEGNGFYLNARSALYAITKVCAIRRVWLPSYLCGAIVEPFLRAGLEIAHYPVNQFLEVVVPVSRFSPGDAVLAIDYFGVKACREQYATWQRNGAIVIEDLSQALFSQPDGKADFSVYSLRKFLPFPDGGIVVPAAARRYAWPYADSVNLDALELAVAAIHERTAFDTGRTASRSWFDAYREWENGMETGLCPMSGYTRERLARGGDMGKEQQSRKENFDCLLAELSEFALIKDRRGAVPMGFPVVVNNRDCVQRALFEESIYPPIHWKLDGIVPRAFSGSHELSSRILTIPVDPRYDTDDMSYVASALKAVT